MMVFVSVCEGHIWVIFSSREDYTFAHLVFPLTYQAIKFNYQEHNSLFG
jgi:hypothetical protein